jgi:hypothetical protein
MNSQQVQHQDNLKEVCKLLMSVFPQKEKFGE